MSRLLDNINSIEYALRLNTNYESCFLMRKIEEDIKFFVDNLLDD